MVRFPSHPREALWGGRHTLSEQRLIREWMQAHPLQTDGKVQQSLWYHFGRRPASSSTAHHSASAAENQMVGLLSRDRTCNCSPFFNPGKELTTRLRDLGIAVCADFAGDHGTPCAVGVAVETNGSVYWSGHAPVARSGEASVE